MSKGLCIVSDVKQVILLTYLTSFIILNIFLQKSKRPNSNHAFWHS